MRRCESVCSHRSRTKPGFPKSGGQVRFLPVALCLRAGTRPEFPKLGDRVRIPTKILREREYVGSDPRRQSVVRETRIGAGSVAGSNPASSTSSISWFSNGPFVHQLVSLSFQQKKRGQHSHGLPRLHSQSSSGILISGRSPRGTLTAEITANLVKRGLQVYVRSPVIKYEFAVPFVTRTRTHFYLDGEGRAVLPVVSKTTCP